MNTPIQQTHAGIVITYDERENKWTFTLRDRDRSADSLAQAKEFIDKPVPRNERKSFKRIAVWWHKWNERPKKAEVTGIAERKTYANYVWITCEGQRSKQNTREVFPQNATNDRLFEQILAKLSELDVLDAAIEELEFQRTTLELPKDE